MANLTLIRGLPGSGKSTLAQKLASQANDGYHVEADMYFVNENGVYQFNPKRLSEAHKWCLEQTFNALRDGKDVYVSNTFTTKKEMQPYIDFAKSMHILPNVILMQGQFESIHDVPGHAIERMRSRFEYDL